jgi:hypothetical protein
VAIERTAQQQAKFQADLARIRKVLELRATTEYSPDCPACLRGRVHTQAEHDRVLGRVYETSRA